MMVKVKFDLQLMISSCQILPKMSFGSRSGQWESSFQTGDVLNKETKRQVFGAEAKFPGQSELLITVVQSLQFSQKMRSPLN